MKLSKVALRHMENLKEFKNAAQQRDQHYASKVADLRRHFPGLYELFNSTHPVDMTAEPTRRLESVTTGHVPVTPVTPPQQQTERHTDSFDLRELSLVSTLNDLLRKGVACGKGIPNRIQMPPYSIKLLVQLDFVQDHHYIWHGTVRIPLEAIPFFHQDAISLIY
jgi:hypothetical protein